MSTDLVWSRTDQARVVVSVTNRATRPVTAKVWWIVGQVGDEHPWLDPVAMSPRTTVALPAAATVAVPIPGTGLPADGSYALSAWTHVVEGQASSPSDGVALAARLTVERADGRLTHRRTADLTLTVTGARLRRAPVPAVEASVTNSSLRPRTVRLCVSVEGSPCRLADLVVEAATTTSVVVPVPRPAGYGPVTLTVGSLAPDGTVRPGDEVLLPG